MAARYLDATEKKSRSSANCIFTGANFVITVRHGRSPDLGVVRRRMEADPQMLAFGSEGIIYAIWTPWWTAHRCSEGLANDIEEIEDQVFTNARTGVPGASTN